MKLNLPELAHYIIGGAVLIVSFPYIMTCSCTDGNIYLSSAVWMLEYIIVDQILHVFIKHEKISIIK